MSSPAPSLRASEIYSLRRLASTAFISWAGALLEWIDFYTYMLLAIVVAEKFFPSEDPIASMLASFAALAIGFLFRPLGALLFGRIGDIYGRKFAFILAITLLMLGTLSLGLLPTYAKIGVAASIAVFLLRIMQGLALGGGYGAAIVYLGESVPEHRRGLITGLLFTTPAAAIAIIAGIISIIQSALGKAAFEAWGWRLVFVISALLGFGVAITLHLLYRETPIFEALRTVRRRSTAPIRELIGTKSYLVLVLIAWLGVVGAHGPVWYTNQIVTKYYVGNWIPKTYGVEPPVNANTVLSICTLAALWSYVVFGWLSDKIGRRPILLTGIYLNALMFIPVFYLLKKAVLAGNAAMIWGLTYLLTFLNGIGYSGAQSSFLLELFPARVRLTGVAFSYNLGYGITGGLTPFMITALYKYVTGDWFTAVVTWSTVVPMIMGLIYVFKGWETLGTRIWLELSAKEFMKKPLIVRPADTIITLASKLVESGYRAAVVRVNGKVGVVGERRILKALAEGKKPDARVSDIYIEVPCVETEDPLPTIITVMHDYGVRVIPVCDKSGDIVGQIEARELLSEVAGVKSIIAKRISERFTVEDLGRSPITIRSDATVEEAVKVMAKNDIGFLPVVEDSKLIAVFSERDLVKLLASGGKLSDPIIAYATKNPITVSCSSTIKEAASIMLKHNIRHLVCVEDGRPRRVISIREVLNIG